ncbi:MAG: Uma2 family endonuclease [Microscillaceae bacterium]
MQAYTQAKLSLEEYLQLEEDTHQKYEYYDGEVYAMAGGSYRHNTISGNIFSEINQRLKGKECQIMNSDTKLYLQKSNAYLYPDAMILCGQKESAESYQDAFTNPVMIIEVLSKSTEAYDRGDKFGLYRKINNLRHYALIKQEEAKIDLYSRQSPTAFGTFRP